jgi:uncharacterized membrane protein
MPSNRPPKKKKKKKEPKPVEAWARIDDAGRIYVASTGPWRNTVTNRPCKDQIRVRIVPVKPKARRRK